MRLQKCGSRCIISSRSPDPQRNLCDLPPQFFVSLPPVANLINTLNPKDSVFFFVIYDYTWCWSSESVPLPFICVPSYSIVQIRTVIDNNNGIHLFLRTLTCFLFYTWLGELSSLGFRRSQHPNLSQLPTPGHDDDVSSINRRSISSHRTIDKNPKCLLGEEDALQTIVLVTNFG